MSDCTPPYSYVDYTLTEDMIDPEPQTFVYGMDLLDEGVAPVNTQILVYHNDTLLTTAQWEESETPSAVDILLIGAGGPTLEVGDRIRIQRDTEKCERFIDWNNNALINKSDMNLDANQLFFLIQEATDLAEDSMRKNSTGEYWNAEALRIGNGLPASEGSDFVTLNQAYDILGGQLTTNLGTVTCWDFEADGVVGEYELDGAPLGLGPNQVFVTVDGVLQCPCGEEIESATVTIRGEEIDPGPGASSASDYIVGVIDGVVYLVFIDVPAENAAICVRMFSGTVASVLQDNSVTGDQIVTETIDETKLGMTASEDAYARVIIVAQDGSCTVRRPTVADISDFTTTINARKLSSFTAPDASVAFGSQKITGLASGTASTDAVNKGQMDGSSAAAVVTANAYTDAQLAASSTNKSGVWSQQVLSLAYGSDQTRTIPAAYGGLATFNNFHLYAEDASGNVLLHQLLNVTHLPLATPVLFSTSGRDFYITRNSTNLVFAATSGFGATPMTENIRIVLYFNA